MNVNRLYSWLKYGFDEIKFIRSANDIKIFGQKLPFLFPRLGDNNYFNNAGVPPSLQLEPTNHCNLKCISCPNGRISREKGFLDYDLFKKIIAEASGIGVKRVHLYLHGEPLLHPLIVQMIRDIKSKGLGVNVVTNGMLLDKAKIEGILSSGVNSADYFTFSVLGATKLVHEKVMKGVDHEKVLKNINDFLNMRKKLRTNGPVIETIFYAMQGNDHEIEQFRDNWDGIVDHVRVVRKISRSFANFKLGGGSIPVRSKSCKHIWERMAIHWNGNIALCCEDVDGRHIFGNAADKSIKEIWNCNGLMALKKMHKENRIGDIPMCSQCDQ